MELGKNISSLFMTLIITMTLTCAHTSPGFLSIRGDAAYKALNSNDKSRVGRIVELLDKMGPTERGYYYQKLELLLSTKTEEEGSNYESNSKRLSRSVQSVAKKTAAKTEDDSNAEEELEEVFKNDNEWEEYTPEDGDISFLVKRFDFNNILVKIKVFVKGDPEVINNILYLEDAIEKHASLPGFSVNLIFVNYEADDVFVVEADLGKWVTSHNWGGSYESMAHELFHLMGLPDEYDGIESHAGNEHLSMTTRLWYFERQLTITQPVDAREGIMCFHWLKPLERHACAAVGLGLECAFAREAANQ